MNNIYFVGPILLNTTAMPAILAAFELLNPQVNIDKRGSYVRIYANQELKLTDKSISEFLGKPFIFPQDLEMLMASMMGKLSYKKCGDVTEAIWTR